MTARIINVVIDDSVWTQAEKEGRSEGQIACAKSKIAAATEALKSAPQEIFLLNGHAMTGDYCADIMLTSKTLQIALVPHDAPVSKGEPPPIRRISSYTSITLLGLKKNYAAIEKGDKTMLAISQGAEMMTQGPLRRLVDMAITALPSLREPG